MNAPSAPRADKLVALFPPHLRTASDVRRWSLMRVLQPDDLASHSFYVTIYANSVARLIQWPGSYATLLYLALTHDLEETVTGFGDLISFVKDAVVDRQRYDDYADVKMRELLPDIAHWTGQLVGDGSNPAQERQADEAWAIITVADRLDALLFLYGEINFGNRKATKYVASAEARLYSAFMELPKARQELDALWNTVMKPVIRAHQENGGSGV